MKRAAMIPRQLQYRKRFHSVWAGYTGNYFYGWTVAQRGAEGLIFANDEPGGPLYATRFELATGKTLARYPQPYSASEHAREIDSHHGTNPIVWHPNGIVYSRRGGDNRCMFKLDPASGIWTAIPEFAAPDGYSWGGDALAILDAVGDTLIYRYGDSRETMPYAAYDLKTGAYRASLGPFLPRVDGAGFRYGDLPKIANGISVLAAFTITNGVAELVLEAVKLTGEKLWQKRWPSNDVSGWRYLALESGQFVFYTTGVGATPFTYAYTVRVLDLQTGVEQWSKKVDASVDRPMLAAADGVLYVVGAQQQLALDLATGGVKWSKTQAFPGDGYVHFNFEAGRVMGGDLQRRRLLVTTDALWFVHGVNTWYAPTPSTGTLVALNRTDGALAQKIDLAALVKTPDESLSLVNDLLLTDKGIGVLLTLNDASLATTPNDGMQEFLYFSTDPPPPQPPVIASMPKATYLGQDRDRVSPGGSLTPDGHADHHIKLTGLKSPVTKVRITERGGGVWEGPFNGQNWVILLGPSAMPGGLECWFSPYGGTAFHVTVTYTTGAVEELDTAAALSGTTKSDVTITQADGTTAVVPSGSVIQVQ